jgi:prepilin-type N-terminal cleavage/methylation domain-containing protein
MKFSINSLIRNAGFTMVELLLTSSVGAVVIAATLVGFVTVQRSGVVYMASSEARANQVRLIDALQRDLRNATSYTLGGGGALPITMSLPNRFSDYELTGNRAGEPKLGAGAVRPAVTIDITTGKWRIQTPFRFASFRQMSPIAWWSSRGDMDFGRGENSLETDRPIPDGAQITIEEIPREFSQSTASPDPKVRVATAVLTVRSAAATQANRRTPATFSMSETLFLRNKVYTR